MDRIFIIAEAGVNHNGSLETARRLIDAAAAAGADAVKFQTFKTENLICRDAQKAAYQMETTDAAESQFEMLKKLELTPQMHEELMAYCRQKGIRFLSTPFDVDSLHDLVERGIELIKLPSGEITNYPLLREAARSGKKIILSTGMSTLDEVRNAVDVLKGSGGTDITALHCNTEYPTPYADVNLAAMGTIRDEIGVPVGYSDHTGLGAVVIEKHFTLDRNMEGPDHKASLEPDELAEMVRAVRHIELAIGSGRKEPSQSEKKNMDIARKSIVAGCDIKAGESFTEENVTAKRPGTGLSPMLWNQVIGQKAKRDFAADEMIEL